MTIHSSLFYRAFRRSFLLFLIVRCVVARGLPLQRLLEAMSGGAEDYDERETETMALSFNLRADDPHLLRRDPLLGAPTVSNPMPQQILALGLPISVMTYCQSSRWSRRRECAFR